ncbi:hypothetical protein [Streptomyces griseus]|uniref:hypothetical protein n=1 Tax=Streptomyces griseus TaxID=1911 RepID=UPI00084081B2|nr:hypothetical protein [Streptomyces griseus]
MTRSQLHPLRAVVGAVCLLLSACTVGAADEKQAHPVFDVPVEQQPRQALLATQAARTARFTQSLTFTSPDGDTVQTSTGRVDFPGGRAAGSIAWTLAEGLPEEAKDALLGTRLGAGRSPAGVRVAVEPDTIRLRAGEAGYWLSYAGASAAFGGDDAIDVLRGAESAFGGTLLETVSGVQDVKESPAGDGGRTYRAKLTAFNALRMFSKDLRAELTSDIDPNGTATPVTLGLSADAEGRITRAEADLSALLDRKDSALAGTTGLRAVLTLGGFGASEPAMPAPSERTLDAKKATTAVGEVAEGACADLTTGTRILDMVVSVPCAGPHEARVYAHEAFGARYPGDRKAKRMARAACDEAYGSAPAAWTAEGAKKDHYWYTWPGEGRWGVGAEPVVTCYVLTR